jgi:benzodiazapine receptor
MSGLSRPLTIAALAAVATAIAGGAMTRIDDWYRGLETSALNPPDWAFAPAWTVIYAVAVISATLGWRAARTNRERAWLISLFFFNAVLNIAWSAIFFTLRRPDWALAEVGMLWLSVAILIGFLVRFSRPAALLLVPYLAWVSFAAWLNYRVVVLNAPFA